MNPTEQPEFAWIPEPKSAADRWFYGVKKKDIETGRSERILFFPWGLTYSKRDDQVSAKWGDVSVLRSVIKTVNGGRHTATSYHYTIFFPDGTKRSVTWVPGGPEARRSEAERIQSVPGTTVAVTLEQAGRLLEARIRDAKLPTAFERYNSGKPVSFGSLSLSQAGISSWGKLVPWSEVSNVRMERGWVFVDKVGKRPSKEGTQVKNIPNYLVFATLIEAILSQRGPAAH